MRHYTQGTQADGDNTLAEPRQPRTSQAYKMLIIDVGEPTPDLVEIFVAFCSFGRGDPRAMEGKTFNKIMKVGRCRLTLSNPR